ncbi:hypothetical protein LSTR_LSTR005655 [Laodelphax striatellus]|uniref:Peptidase C39-like domain-containing protein n=1 Tax=Laodelphax striatellus TaxID=195883 RepID=A0A482WUZ2_LAOST|nr:hypothetical protein LSTR_LSTR005655 [Laodelphax striatellus]
MGINPDYRDHDFYHRIISKDSERVIERFKSAQINGITIVQQEIDMYHVIRHVYRHGPVILLTDANSLTCDDCKIMRFNPGDLKCFTSLSKLYHGHFVIVMGYDLSEQKVFYRNPCFKQRICTTSFISLDSAWKHEGTDQDAIFIHHYDMGSS